MPAVFLLSLCVLPGRAAIPFHFYLFPFGINKGFMISFAADLGRSGPIFAAYAQIGPAIFGTLLPHSKTPPLLWPERKQKERFLLGIFVILHNVPHKAPRQQMAAFHIAAHHQHSVAADILYYLYIMYLNIQCSVITPIHRIGDGAHAAGIADHGGVGCGVAQGLPLLRCGCAGPKRRSRCGRAPAKKPLSKKFERGFCFL